MASGFLSGVAGGATVAIAIKAVDDFSATFKKAEGETSKLAGAFKVAGAAALAIGTALVGIGVSAAKAAAQAQPIRESFQKLAVDSDNFLATLNEVTKGTVSDFSLMEKANKALLLGIDQNTLPDLFKNAAIVGRAAGRSTTEAIDDITIGIGRQSKLILDNLGIIVKAEEAYDSYAASIGKVSSELTEEEKKAAFTAAAIDSLNKKAASLGGEINEGSATAFERFNKVIDDAKVKLGDALLPALTEIATVFVDKVFPAIQPLIPLIADALVQALETLAPYLPELVQNFSALFVALVPIIPPLTKILAIILELASSALVRLIPLFEALTPVVVILANVFEKIANFLGKILEFILKIAAKVAAGALNFVTGGIGSITGINTKKVNDFIIRPDGTVLETSPQDTIIGTKNPGALGGGATYVFNIDRIYGVDADDIARAFTDKLRTKITL